MTRIAAITKSFAPDFQLCASLNRSVLDNSPDTVHHHIIVPRSDLKLFGRLAGPRTHIRCEADFLPSTFVPLPFSNIRINLARPFPPVRGWIQQQVVKLAAVAASEDDVVLVADSDVEFFRPFTAEMFARDGKVRFFCKQNQIDKRLPRHMIWHRVARSLLGLPPAEPPYADYISSPLAWDPMIVRRMLAHLTATTGRPWPTAIAGQLHFSECVLYGVFVDGVIGAPANSFASDDPLCLVYWEHTPLNLDSAAHFIRGVRPTDIAAVIQSKSKTPLAVRQATFAALRAAHKPQVARAARRSLKLDPAV
jgi:Family of unknown function (DUF6492)